MDGDGAKENGTLGSEERKKSMRYSIADGMGYSAMTGIGDAYLPAAALAIGATNFQIGMLAALPQLCGAVLQFLTLNALRAVRDRKLLVLAGCILQALSWLPIIAVLLWQGEMGVPLIIFFFMLGSGVSLMINPVWSSWISDVVPDNERADFFARRNRLMQLTLFATMFVTGFILHELELGFPAAVAFAIVFVLPFLARLSTVFFNSRMSNVHYDLGIIKEIKLIDLFTMPAHRNELWFIAFVALVNFSTQFAAPFFTPYMLNGLGLNVETFGAIIAASVLAKIIAYPYWGKAIDRFGNRAVLVSCAFATTVIPIFWLFTSSPLWLMVFQVYSGFVWAGMDLASFNFALSIVGREMRPSFISKYNAFTGVFFAAGAAAGGLFLGACGNYALFGFGGILLVFLLSGLMRMAIVLAFAPRIACHEAKNTSGERAMVVNLIAVYPTMGAVSQALNGWNFTRRAVEKGAKHGEITIRMGLGATGEILQKGRRKIVSGFSRRGRL